MLKTRSLAPHLFLILTSFFFISCSFLKLDKETNCLNDKAACFKEDKTRPQLAQAIFPASGALISQLEYIELRFSEELNDPQPGDFVLSDAGAVGLTISRVDKTSNYTYRLSTNQSQVSNGPIVLSFTNVRDYAGNRVTGVTDVTYQGNVDIGIRLTTVPTVLTGISATAGGFNQSGFNVAFTHDFKDDDNNTWSACITNGATTCPIGSGFANGSNLASLDKLVSPGSAVALSRTPAQFSTGVNRLVIHVENLAKNKQGTNSWEIFRDDSAPASVYSPPADAYATGQSVELSCSDNSQRIIYTVASQQSTAPAPPPDPTFDAAGMPISPAQIYTGPLSTPTVPDPQVSIYKWLCIDRGGNKETSVKTATYTIDSTIPAVTVNLDTSIYRSFVSATGFTTSTLRFTTNLAAPATYKIVHNALSCTDVGATVLQPLTALPATAGLPVERILTTTTDLPADGVYNVRICVQNLSAVWGFAFLQITRDSTLPSTIANPLGGSFGAKQQVSLTCNDNSSKVAYTVNGTAPTFLANGEVNNGFEATGPIETPEGVTQIRYLCRDKAGNTESVIGSQTYTVDSVLPTITVLSNTYAALSNTGSQTQTTISWTSSRPSSPYTVRLGGTSCTTGSQIDSGTTGATISTPTNTLVTQAMLGGNGPYTIRICVQNLILAYGNTTVPLTVDTTAPTYAGLTSLVSNGSGNFTLNWSAASDGAGSGIAYYNIYRADAIGGPYVTAQHMAAHPATSINVTVPVATNTYYYVAGAVDNAGNETKVTVAEFATKPTIRLLVSGLDTGNAKTFNLTDGVTSATVSANSNAPGAIWATTLAMSDTYTLAVTLQPTGQVCAIRQRQFGTLSADVTVNIDCTDGHQVAGRFQVPQAHPTRIMLYRGNLTTRASGQTNPNSPAVQGGFIYYGNYLDCDGATAGNQYCIYRLGVSTGTPAAHVTGLTGTVRAIVGDGSNLYFATMSPDNRLYKLPQGSTTPIELGSGFSDIYGLALDGNVLFVSEKTAGQIRRFDLATGVLTTVITGLAPNGPVGLTVVGADLYFARDGVHGVSRIAKTGGAITVPYGAVAAAGHQDNNGTSARFSQPHDLTYDGAENIYLTEFTGHRIRRIHLTTGRVTTIAGDGTNTSYTAGTGVSAKIPSPIGITSDGRNLYFTAHGPSHNVVKLGEMNLVAHWPLNGQAADYANGSLVTPYSLTPTGGFTYPAGRFNETPGAHRFDGSNYLTVADQTQYDLTGYYTISVWINRNATGSMRIIDKITPGSCDGYNLDILSDNRLRMNYCLVNGAGQEVISGSTIPTGQWVHVLATFSTLKQKARLYINGHLDAEKATGGGQTLTNALSLRIGADHTTVPGPQYLFSGAMAEVRIYSRVLSDAEINELAQDASAAFVGSSFNTGATEMLTHLSFDPGFGAPLLGDDGALAISMGTFNAPGNGIGKDGDTLGSHIFDGVTQYIGNSDVNQRGLPQGNAPRTVCAFFLPAELPAAGLHYMFSYGDAAAFDQAYGLAIARDGGTNYISHVFGSPSITDDHVYAYKAHINTWQHICAAYDGAVSQLFYNGQQVSTKARTLATNSSNIFVGSFIGGVQNFAGQVDDVRVYNKVLTANEVRQLATQIPVGLVARYDFTGDRDDMSGFGHHLVNNGSTLTTDRFGFANASAGFGGAAHLAASATNFPLGNSSRTMCAWTRPTAFVNGVFSEVAMYGTNGAKTGWGFGMDSGGPNGGRFFILDTTGDMIYLRPHVFNIWRHVCATYDGTVESLYVDGKSVASKNPGGLATAAGSIIVGRGIFGPGDYFIGDIDDVRVYSRILSVTEIRTLQQQPNKRLQLSGATYDGALGGIGGADSRCPGGFKAMIVDGVNRRACTTPNCSGGMDEHIDWVLRANITYVTSTGLSRILTADWNDVWNFAGTAPTGGNLQDEIVNSSQAAWTGLTGNWQVANGGTDHDCANWSSASAGQTGAYGRTNGLGTNSIFNSTDTCDDAGNYLYCAEQ